MYGTVIRNFLQQYVSNLGISVDKLMIIVEAHLAANGFICS